MLRRPARVQTPSHSTCPSPDQASFTTHTPLHSLHPCRCLRPRPPERVIHLQTLQLRLSCLPANANGRGQGRGRRISERRAARAATRRRPIDSIADDRSPVSECSQRLPNPDSPTHRTKRWLPIVLCHVARATLCYEGRKHLEREGEPERERNACPRRWTIFSAPLVDAVHRSSRAPCQSRRLSRSRATMANDDRRPGRAGQGPRHSAKARAWQSDDR